LNTPPPEAVVLAITGVQGPADAAAVEAALRRCDPAARSWNDWPRGLIAVQSAAPPAALCAAVQAAGDGVLLRGAGRPRGGIAGIFLRPLLYAVLGAVVGVLVGVGLGLANAFLNPDCTAPGSSGGCAIGVGLFGIGLGLIGLPVGAVAGLVHGLARRYG
jgi:hypothetical protein